MANDPNVWLTIAPGLFGLAGTVVGGFITWGVQNYGRTQERNHKRRSISLALAAEVSSYLDLMDHRNHVQNVTRMIEANRAGVRTLPLKWLTDEERNASAFPIFYANLENLGVIDAEALADLATFHRRVAGVRATIINAMEGAYNEMEPGQIADIMQNELVLWQNAVALGRSVARALKLSVDDVVA